METRLVAATALALVLPLAACGEGQKRDHEECPGPSHA